MTCWLITSMATPGSCMYVHDIGNKYLTLNKKISFYSAFLNFLAVNIKIKLTFLSGKVYRSTQCNNALIALLTIRSRADQAFSLDLRCWLGKEVPLCPRRKITCSLSMLTRWQQRRQWKDSTILLEPSQTSRVNIALSPSWSIKMSARILCV